MPTVGDAPCDAITEEWHLVARAVYFWVIRTVTSQVPSGLVCLVHSELQNGEEETANGAGMVPSSHPSKLPLFSHLALSDGHGIFSCIHSSGPRHNPVRLTDKGRFPFFTDKKIKIQRKERTHVKSHSPAGFNSSRGDPKSGALCNTPHPFS